MSENPYATPTDPGFILAERRNFKDMPTRDLNKLRNDSHSIRAIAALMLLSVLGFSIIFGSVIMVGISLGTSGVGMAELAAIGIFVIIPGFTGYALLKRPKWGRVVGFISGVFMLLGFPIGTLIGIFFLISLIRGERLFGPDRIPHKDLETEWKYRRKNKVQ